MNMSDYFEKIFKGEEYEDFVYVEDLHNFWIKKDPTSFASVCISKDNGEGKLFIKGMKLFDIDWTLDLVQEFEHVFSMAVSVLAYSRPQTAEELKHGILRYSASLMNSQFMTSELFETMLNAKRKIYTNVSTDSEGVSYNSIEFC